MNNSAFTNYWDKNHKKYLIKGRRYESEYAKDREKHFPRNCDVLDLGGGMGFDSIYFAEMGHRVVLTDISPFALEKAEQIATSKKQHISTVFFDMKNSNFPFEKNSFDIVYSRLSLHFFDFQTTKNIFKEIFRILKPKGVTYLTFKSPKDKKEMDYLIKTAKEIEKGVFLDQNIVKSIFSKSQLGKMLNSIGIENFEITKYIEKLNLKEDFVKSGNKEFVLNEVIIKK